jgi:hypothetical protein
LADPAKDNVDSHFHREGDALVLDAQPDPKQVAADARQDEAHEFQRKLVESARLTAWFNALLVFATVCTIGVGVWQGKTSQEASHAARDAADAAAKSATTQRDALTISERPWVSIDVQPNSDIGFSESGMFMYDILAINNRGVTPAVNARAEIQMVGSGVDEAVQKMCSGLETDSARTRKPYLREAYFTGVPTYKPWVLTFDQIKEGHSGEHNGTFEPIVIACVAYQSSFEPHVWHHTWKAYAVIKKDAQSLNGTYVMEDGKAVKKANVILAPWVRPEGED